MDISETENWYYLQRKLFTVSAGHKSQYGMTYFNSKLRGSAAKEKGPQRKKPVLRLTHMGTECSSTPFFYYNNQ